MINKTYKILRFFDIFFSFCAILFFSPLFLFVSLMLLMTGEREVFYKQLRMGKNERKFYLLKFATMLKNSPSIGSCEVTLQNDYRVLPVGKILRKTKINELPQLINVLIGDMSIVGPRPQTEIYYYILKNNFNKVSEMKPGLSGIGSLVFRNEEDILAKVKNPVEFDKKIITPYKAKLESWFFENYGIVLYFKIIILTIIVVLFPKININKKLKKIIPKPPLVLQKIIF